MWAEAEPFVVIPVKRAKKKPNELQPQAQSATPAPTAAPPATTPAAAAAVTGVDVDTKQPDARTVATATATAASTAPFNADVLSLAGSDIRSRLIEWLNRASTSDDQLRQIAHCALRLDASAGASRPAVSSVVAPTQTAPAPIATTTATCRLLQLPDDVLIGVFRYLDTVTVSGAVLCTCTNWYRLALAAPAPASDSAVGSSGGSGGGSHSLWSRFGVHIKHHPRAAKRLNGYDLLYRCAPAIDTRASGSGTLAPGSGGLFGRLERFELVGTTAITDTALSRVWLCCPLLTAITVSACPKVSDVALTALSTAACVLRLTSLDISNCERVTDTGLLALARSLPTGDVAMRLRSLQHLNVSGCEELTDRGLCAIIAATTTAAAAPTAAGAAAATAASSTAARVSSLRSLRLRGCILVSDETLQSIGQFCRRLTVLDVRVCPLLTDDGVARVDDSDADDADGEPALDRKTASTASAPPVAGFGYVASQCRVLTEVSLSSSCGDGAVRALAAGSTAWLRTVRASNCVRLSDAGLTALSICKSLRVLNVRWCNAITDRGIISVLSGTAAASLHSINLSACKKVSDAALSAIAKRCTQLHTLRLRGCSAVTNAGIRELSTGECAATLTILDLRECYHCGESMYPHRVVGLDGETSPADVKSTKPAAKPAAAHSVDLTSSGLAARARVLSALDHWTLIGRFLSPFECLSLGRVARGLRTLIRRRDMDHAIWRNWLVTSSLLKRIRSAPNYENGESYEKWWRADVLHGACTELPNPNAVRVIGSVNARIRNVEIDSDLALGTALIDDILDPEAPFTCSLTPAQGSDPTHTVQPGRYRMLGYTLNLGDSNLTRAAPFMLTLHSDKRLTAEVFYGTGANYNKEAVANWDGLWTSAGRVLWREVLPGYSAPFNYTGVIVGPQIIGTYKWEENGAVGFFRFGLSLPHNPKKSGGAGGGGTGSGLGLALLASASTASASSAKSPTAASPSGSAAVVVSGSGASASSDALPLNEHDTTIRTAPIESWSSVVVSQWLLRTSMSPQLRAWIAADPSNALDGQTLLALDDEMLTGCCGVTNKIHRVKLLAAIDALRKKSAEVATAAAAAAATAGSITPRPAGANSGPNSARGAKPGGTSADRYTELSTEPLAQFDLKSASVDELKRRIRLLDWGDLKLGDRLGEGSFGVCHKAIWNHGTVVVKTPTGKNTDVKAFLQEAVLLEQLGRHPHIIQFLGAVVSDAHVALVMEFAMHGTLENVIFNSTRFSSMSLSDQLKRVTIASDIAKGLSYLHREGVIHRDLACRNILLCNDYQAKVNDFGMSRAVKTESTQGKTETAIGPIKWMSPESLKEQTYSKKSDVWMFGVLMWEIWARKPPYEGMRAFDVGLSVINHGSSLAIPATWPPAIADLIRACLEIDPVRRPTIDAVLERLDAYYTLLKTPAKPEAIVAAAKANAAAIKAAEAAAAASKPPAKPVATAAPVHAPVPVASSAAAPKPAVQPAPTPAPVVVAAAAARYANPNAALDAAANSHAKSPATAAVASPTAAAAHSGSAPAPGSGSISTSAGDVLMLGTQSTMTGAGCNDGAASQSGQSTQSFSIPEGSNVPAPGTAAAAAAKSSVPAAVPAATTVQPAATATASRPPPPPLVLYHIAPGSSIRPNNLSAATTPFAATLRVLTGAELTTWENPNQTGGYYTHPKSFDWNDSWEHTFSLSASGRYDIRGVGVTNGDHAIVRFSVDGQLVSHDAAQDWYSPAVTWNVDRVIASHVPLRAGVHTLRGAVTGKNDKSGNYSTCFTRFMFVYQSPLPTDAQPATATVSAGLTTDLAATSASSTTASAAGAAAAVTYVPEYATVAGAAGSVSTSSQPPLVHKPSYVVVSDGAYQSLALPDAATSSQAKK